MLLMDTSGSIGWGHMPDEVEDVLGVATTVERPEAASATRARSATSCTTTRRRCTRCPSSPTALRSPRRASPPPATTPTTPARPRSSTCRRASRPTTTNPVAAPSAGTLKVEGRTTNVPQAAYYWVHTGGSAITSYASPTCADTDTGGRRHASPPATAAPGRQAGRARRRAPGATDERLNFAIWYTYYRTRLHLIKSAASLAFTPLTDSFRVGFITMNPKDTPTSRGDQSRQVPADRRLRLDPARPVVRQAVLADAGRLVAGARRPGARGPPLRGQAGRHQHRHDRAIRCSTRASRTSPS